MRDGKSLPGKRNTFRQLRRLPFMTNKFVVSSRERKMGQVNFIWKLRTKSVEWKGSQNVFLGHARIGKFGKKGLPFHTFVL